MMCVSRWLFNKSGASFCSKSPDGEYESTLFMISYSSISYLGGCAPRKSLGFAAKLSLITSSPFNDIGSSALKKWSDADRDHCSFSNSTKLRSYILSYSS